VKQDKPGHADAIVIPMGSITDRILQAVDIFQSGSVDRLLIVEGQNDGYRELIERGADMVSGTRQMGNAAVAMGIPANRVIILPGGAKSTQDEAMIINEYLSDKPDVDTLMLISSAPHMRRAYLIFKRTFKQSHTNICILCCPSSYTDFNAKKWWMSKDDIETVFMEYMKIAYFFLIDIRKS